MRPEQTTHKFNTRFIKKEVFKTNHLENHPANEIIGRCYVLFVDDYIRGKPAGVNEDEIYVCESRYSIKAKNSQKIKNWSSCLPARASEIDLELYDKPKALIRGPLETEVSINPTPSKRKRDEQDELQKKRLIMETPRLSITSTPTARPTRDVQNVI